MESYAESLEPRREPSRKESWSTHDRRDTEDTAGRASGPYFFFGRGQDLLGLSAVQSMRILIQSAENTLIMSRCAGGPREPGRRLKVCGMESHLGGRHGAGADLELFLPWTM